MDRLMREESLSGVVRGRQRPPGGRNAGRAAELLDYDFTAEAPNREWVTDFIYCERGPGCMYVAFVAGCFLTAIVGSTGTRQRRGLGLLRSLRPLDALSGRRACLLLALAARAKDRH